MSPQSIKIVQATFENAIKPNSEAVSNIFYTTLFELEPDLRLLFKEDLSIQKHAFMQMLGVVVRGLDKPETIILTIQNLGKRHVNYGAKDEHYAAVGAALLRTLEHFLGQDYTPAVDKAWREVFNLLATLMKRAAAQAVPMPV